MRKWKPSILQLVDLTPYSNYLIEPRAHSASSSFIKWVSITILTARLRSHPFLIEHVPHLPLARPLFLQPHSLLLPPFRFPLLLLVPPLPFLPLLPPNRFPYPILLPPPAIRTPPNSATPQLLSCPTLSSFASTSNLFKLSFSLCSCRSDSSR